MASGTIKQALSVKEFTATATTSEVGTWIVPSSQMPSDCHAIVGIKSSTAGGGNYMVQFQDRTFGIYSYDAPHNPLANTSVTVTFYYI